jgi:AcrR family transcriptional regulator
MTKPNRQIVDADAGAAESSARPTETSRQRARKDEILEAARLILIEEGHHRLTLRNVAGRVGIKLSTVQYYFPTKKELITDLIDWGEEPYEGVVDALIALKDVSSTQPNRSLTEALESILNEYQDENLLNFNEQIWALSVQDEQMMDQYLDGYVDIWNTATDGIGRLDPDSTQAEHRNRAAFIIALMDGLETFMSDKKLRGLLSDTVRDDLAKLIMSIARGSK